ncbi:MULTISPECIES: hypothetical protein [unclassified Adlercreutzia]|uniref:hypothetical protein n=1 Tax=unclassified Adlercreutzia TaxID=2636013 RepID=UPI0013EC2B18|nr:MULTISPECIES: hypothetical protein [unclassified Adlercreutzia]
MSAQSGDNNRQFCFGELEVNADDVITVREALASCASRDLLEAVLGAEAGWHVSVEALDGACAEALVRKIEASLRCMLNVPSRADAHPESLVVPWEWLEVVDARGTLRRRVGAAVLDGADVPEMAALLDGGASRVAGLAALRDAEGGVGRACAGRPWAWRRLERSVLPLAFEPWSETLGRRMWVPRSLCGKERCLAVGSVFWAMTYFGFGAARARRPPRGAAWRKERFLDGQDGLSGEVLFAPEVPVGRLSPSDEDYVFRLTRIAELFNYNSWIDLLQALVELDALKTAA